MFLLIHQNSEFREWRKKIFAHAKLKTTNKKEKNVEGGKAVEIFCFDFLKNEDSGMENY